MIRQKITRTRKYITAEQVAHEEGFHKWDSRAKLYRLMGELGYTWDVNTDSWLFLADSKAKATVKVRVLADLDQIEAIATQIVESQTDLTLIERSKVYPFVPKLEGRVYLTFAPKFTP